MHDNTFIRTLNIIADWLIRIVVINIFMVLLTIPIVTFYAGYKAAYSLFVDYTNDKTTPIFRGFWENLKKDFWHNVGIGGVFLVLIALGFLGALNYNNLLTNDPENLFYIIGQVITVGVSLLFVLTMLYAVTVSYMISDLSLKNLFKVSLVLVGKYFLRSLLVIIVTILPILLFINLTFAPIFVFVGLSIPTIINVLLMKKPRRFLKGDN